MAGLAPAAWAFDCPPRVKLQGPPDLVRGVREHLSTVTVVEAGGSDDAYWTCPDVLVVLARRGERIDVARANGGRNELRSVHAPETAAVLIETWALADSPEVFETHFSLAISLQPELRYRASDFGAAGVGASLSLATGLGLDLGATVATGGSFVPTPTSDRYTSTLLRVAWPVRFDPMVLVLSLSAGPEWGQWWSRAYRGASGIVPLLFPEIAVRVPLGRSLALQLTTGADFVLRRGRSGDFIGVRCGLGVFAWLL
ncbi:MAG: hypothetical protein IT384_27495 [Deltaproteobacteria bacterium]|nr:hypothetical protein [Deltaproteobacteria bacterium]